MYLPVHNIDLKRWGLRKAREISYSDFKASDSWLNNFKKQFKISSRKITKYVTLKHEEDSDILSTVMKTFLNEVNTFITLHRSQLVINTDQSGFEYEIMSSRTLSKVGEKKTLAAIQSSHSTTHSYTIQPTISIAGEIFGPLLICLQETGNSFGPVVQQKMFKAPNIFTLCSTSGKMSKELIRKWFSCCILPNVNESFILLHDSWTGQTDNNIYDPLLPNGILCKRFIIPPGATSVIQPLDVYFNRQWKIFVHKITERVLLDQEPVILHHRDNILKMHSLIHNQFKSPKFQDMIKYSFYKSGYATDVINSFKNVLQVCFNFDDIGASTSCNLCDNAPFIICSRCNGQLRITHFFIKCHFHSDNE